MFCGLLTVAYSTLVLLFMPDSPMEARFLSDREKVIAVERLRANQMGIISREWRWDHVWETASDVKTWLWFFLIVTISCVHPHNLPYSTIITNRMQNPQRRHQHIRQPNHQILRLRIVRNHPVQHTLRRYSGNRHPRRRMAGCTVPKEGASDCPVCGDFCYRDVVDDCCAEGAEGSAFVWVLLGRTLPFVREMCYINDVCTGLLPRGHNAPRVRLGSAKHRRRYEEEVYVGCGIDWDVCGKCRPPFLYPLITIIHPRVRFIANAINKKGHRSPTLLHLPSTTISTGSYI